jgi:hypothetical protein
MAVEMNGATLRADHAGDRLQQRGLAGAVGAQQRHDLALPHGEVSVLNGEHRPVGRRQPADFKQCVSHLAYESPR